MTGTPTDGVMLQWKDDIENTFHLDKINIGIQIFQTFAVEYRL